jgi:hypothetical protein
LHRNCLLEHVIEGKIVKMGKQGRRRKQLLGDLRKRELTGNRKRRHQIVIPGEVAVEESTDLS